MTVWKFWNLLVWKTIQAWLGGINWSCDQLMQKVFKWQLRVSWGWKKFRSSQTDNKTNSSDLFSFHLQDDDKRLAVIILKLRNIKKIYTQKLSLGPNVFLIEGFLRLYYSQGVQRLHIQAFLEKSFWNNSLKKVGSIKISGKLPSYTSPKPTFCPKWEVSLNVGLGEG